MRPRFAKARAAPHPHSGRSHGRLHRRPPRRARHLPPHLAESCRRHSRPLAPWVPRPPAVAAFAPARGAHPSRARACVPLAARGGSKDVRRRVFSLRSRQDRSCSLSSRTAAASIRTACDLRALTAAASGASDAAARSIRHSRTLGRAALADRLARQRAASAVRQRRAERRRLTARALPSGCVRALDEACRRPRRASSRARCPRSKVAMDDGDDPAHGVRSRAVAVVSALRRRCARA